MRFEVNAVSEDYAERGTVGCSGIIAGFEF
jgi:hypothetical protein